jgi:hypothetical protein
MMTMMTRLTTMTTITTLIAIARISVVCLVLGSVMLQDAALSRAADGVPIWSLAWSPRGDDLALTTAAGFQIYSGLNAGIPRLTFDQAGGQQEGVAWSPDGTRGATASASDRLVRLWDAERKLQIAEIIGEKVSSTYYYAILAWSPDGSKLAGAMFSDYSDILVWSVKKDTFTLLNSQSGTFFDFAWSPDNTVIAAAGYGRAWAFEAERPESRYPLGRDSVSFSHPFMTSVAWHPGGAELAVSLADGSIDFIEASENRVLRTLRIHEGPANTLRWSPDGKLIASAGADDLIKVWDAVTGEVVATYTLDRTLQPMNAPLAWSPHGGRLAFVGHVEGVVGYHVPVAASPVALVAPGATRQRLAHLTAQCVTDDRLRDQLVAAINTAATDAPARFLQMLADAGATAISAACKADLQAVAHSLPR